jgi:hypothetical protein
VTFPRTEPEPEPERAAVRGPLAVRQAGESVPAVVWLPPSAAPPRAIVLVGHGGSMDKDAPFITRTAGLLGQPAGDSEAAFARAARQVTIPLLFLLQWDDELFARNDGLALFDLLGSGTKTLHANPGGHLQLPPGEIGQAAQFLRRHLAPDAGPSRYGEPGSAGRTR